MPKIISSIKPFFFQLALLVGIILFFESGSAFGQAFGYQIDRSVKIIRNGDTLEMPWARGLNNPQIQALDLDMDSIDDLVIYDRSGYDFQTFINKGNSWHYDPRYESSLPKLDDGWIVVADANCDGIKDMFTYASAGVRVFANIPDSTFSHWSIFKSTIFYLDSFGWNNLLISQGDYPSIIDIDGDGDTDIATFEWLSGGYLQYFRNMSIEINGNCDSLLYQIDSYCWGRFFECQDCGKYDIDLDAQCKVGGTTLYCQNKAAHSGSTLTHIDINGDSLMDLLLGDIGCQPVVSMRNKGNGTMARMDSARAGFPQYDVAASNFYFPVVFHLDVDFDGRKDLLVTMNSSGNPANSYRLDKSLMYYKDVSLVDSPDFSFQKNGFLQDKMYDVGDFSFPALADFDGDGDLDLFVGNGGRNMAGSFYSNVHYLENTGSPGLAEFTQADTNFLSLISHGFQKIRPFFTDLTGDGIDDFAFVGLDNQGVNSIFHYFENLGPIGGQMVFNSNNLLTYPGVSSFLQRNDMPHFVDISGDGVNDLLVGREVFANVSYYINTGTTQNPTFVLEDYQLGDIGNFWGEQATNVLVRDFNNDGFLDMAYANKEGILTIYNNFVPGIPGTLTGSTHLVYNSLLDTMVNDMLGSSIHIASGDLDADNDLDFIIGSHTGGLQFIRYDTSLISGLSDVAISVRSFGLHVWPNPSSDLLYFNYEGDWERAEIVDLLGRKIRDFRKTELVGNSLRIESIPDGIYLLRVKGEKSIGVARIIVSRD